MAILVSGTPGTGKTTIAKKIAKQKDYRYIDVNKIINKNKKLLLAMIKKGNRR